MKVVLLVSPRIAADMLLIREHALLESGLGGQEGLHVVVLKRSIDARSRSPRIRLEVELTSVEQTVPKPLSSIKYANPRQRVVVVGAGPAGYFAALELLRNGITPIVLERGKDVRTRRRDLRLLQQEGIVNPHSNYCFGEGGAGTYSDGKLYTRSAKRGSVRDVLELLVAHGASTDILIDAHPHIGSNKLWLVVQRIRETILEYGGEVRFDAFVTEFMVHDEPPRRIAGVRLESGEEVVGDAVILSAGHSARDIFELCKVHGVEIHDKPFALGVRIEHPQDFVDMVQYHHTPRDPLLPAASYSQVCQSDGLGVFTFCMCPGGIIVPAATAPGEIVVNGMSMSRRDSKFANSGLVVEVNGGVALQQQVERRAFDAVRGTSQRAPAQRVADFVAHVESSTLPETSYIPGVESVNLHAILPTQVSVRIADAIVQFNKKMHGYLSNDAIVVATESRTSSPIRIVRDSTTLESTTMKGLYPCAEGSGHAGGIVSAAIDGQRVARAIAAQYGNPM